jgi:hypothetical protein
VSDPKNDPDLRDLFQEFRAEDRQLAPEFSRLMDRAKTEAGGVGQQDREGVRTIPGIRVGDRIRGAATSAEAWVRFHRRWIWSGGLAAAAAVTALLLTGPPARTDADFERVVSSYATDPAMGAWTSPTDGLLQVPGTDLLRTVPRIGRPRLPGEQARAPDMNQL